MYDQNVEGGTSVTNIASVGYQDNVLRHTMTGGFYQVGAGLTHCTMPSDLAPVDLCFVFLECFHFIDSCGDQEMLARYALVNTKVPATMRCFVIYV